MEYRHSAGIGAVRSTVVWIHSRAESAQRVKIQKALGGPLQPHQHGQERGNDQSYKQRSATPESVREEDEHCLSRRIVAPQNVDILQRRPSYCGIRTALMASRGWFVT
jgi:hypothetical protein